MKKKLIAIGCSYTSYHWFTWFDYIRFHYKSAVNLGRAGVGHYYIARQAFESKLDADTAVIIMWSDYDRFDYKSNGEWKTQAWGRNHAEYFDEIDSDHMYKSMIESAYGVNAYCKSKGAEVYNFLAFALDASYKRSVTDRNYALLDDLSIVTPDLCSFKNNNPSDIKLEFYDNHPLPSEHYHFYAKVMCPVLGLTVNSIPEHLLEKYDEKCNEWATHPVYSNLLKADQ